MPDPQPSLPETSSLAQPGQVALKGGLDSRLRTALGRANAAVAAILLTSLVLAAVALLAGVRSARSRHRAEQAETEGRVRLWRAYLAQGRAARLSSASGRRSEAMMAVSNAAALWLTKEVRDEAIAASVLPELELERVVSAVPVDQQIVDFSNDLEFYVVAGEHGDFKIYRTGNHEVWRQLSLNAAGLASQSGRDRRAWQVRFSPDSQYFAVSLRDGSLAVWDLPHDRVVFQNAPKTSRVVESDFSFDSRFFAFQDPDKQGALFKVALPSGVPGPAAFALDGAPFALLPETNHVAFARDNEMRIIDLANGEVLQKITAPEAVTSLVSSSDGRRVAATCGGTDVYLWNVDVQRLFVLRGHSERNSTLCFSPDGDRLFSSSSDGTTIFWDCSSGREALRMTECSGLEFSADGRRVACLLQQSRLAILRLVGGKTLQSLEGHGLRTREISRMDLSPDGRWFGAVLADGIQVWDLSAGLKGQFFKLPDARALAFDPRDNALLLGLAGKGLVRLKLNRRLDGEQTGPLELGPPEEIVPSAAALVRHIGISGNGGRACLDLDDGRMMAIDLSGARKPVYLNKRANLTFTLGAAGSSGSGRYALSPDGRLIVVGYGIGKHPQVFDAGSGEFLSEIDAPPSSVVFSHNGQTLVTSGGSHYSLWRVSDWSRIWQRSLPALGNKTGCVGFSGKDQWLAATVDRHRVGILDVKNGEILTILTAPDPQAITGVRLSADGNRLLTTLFNSFPQVWDLAGLQKDLAGFGFSYSDRLPAQPGVILEPGRISSFSASLAWGLLVAACLAILAFIALRHHRHLAQTFVSSQAQALEHQQELELQREMNRLKSNFVSMVSHEFRTPLGIIQSSAEILEAYYERLKPQQRAQHLSEIVSCSTRMKDLMEEVLLLSRVESGRMECNPASVAVPALLQRLAEEAASATNRRCPIEVHTTSLDAPVRLDGRLLSVIISNLLSNAVKYSGAGTHVQLSACLEGAEILLSVQDHGIGIPGKDQANLFSSFHRGANVSNIPGTGLGLVIVKRCAELHGGSVAFSSSEGHGTTFVVRLPTS